MSHAGAQRTEFVSTHIEYPLTDIRQLPGGFQVKTVSLTASGNGKSPISPPHLLTIGDIVGLRGCEPGRVQIDGGVHGSRVCARERTGGQKRTEGSCTGNPFHESHIAPSQGFRMKALREHLVA
jgi:hypothetical protein